MFNLASKFLLATIYKIDPNTSVFRLLLRIDLSPNHFLTPKDLSPEELSIVPFLISKKYVQHIPKNHSLIQDVSKDYTPIQHDDEFDIPKKFLGKKVLVPSDRPTPERYVLSSGGSYALGTFDQDTLSGEL